MKSIGRVRGEMPSWGEIARSRLFFKTFFKSYCPVTILRFRLDFMALPNHFEILLNCVDDNSEGNSTYANHYRIVKNNNPTFLDFIFQFSAIMRISPIVRITSGIYCMS